MKHHLGRVPLSAFEENCDESAASDGNGGDEFEQRTGYVDIETRLACWVSCPLLWSRCLLDIYIAFFIDLSQIAAKNII